LRATTVRTSAALVGPGRQLHQTAAGTRHPHLEVSAFEVGLDLILDGLGATPSPSKPARGHTSGRAFWSTRDALPVHANRVQTNHAPPDGSRGHRPEDEAPHVRTS